MGILEDGTTLEAANLARWFPMLGEYLVDKATMETWNDWRQIERGRVFRHTSRH